MSSTDATVPALDATPTNAVNEETQEGDVAMAVTVPTPDPAPTPVRVETRTPEELYAAKEAPVKKE